MEKKMRGATAIEEITQAAKAAFDNLSDTQKASWEEMFRAIDKNNDGKISFQEYMKSREEGDPNMLKVNPSVFKLVDRNDGGNLQLLEFYTLCYIIASRPTCRGSDCGSDCIFGMFFTCTVCRFDSNVENYDLCVSCYQKKAFQHNHTDFVDNYMLLANMQDTGDQYKSQSMLPLGSQDVERVQEKLEDLTGFSFPDVGSNTAKNLGDQATEESTTGCFSSGTRRRGTRKRDILFDIGKKLASAVASFV